MLGARVREPAPTDEPGLSSSGSQQPLSSVRRLGRAPDGRCQRGARQSVRASTPLSQLDRSHLSPETRERHFRAACRCLGENSGQEGVAAEETWGSKLGLRPLRAGAVDGRALFHPSHSFVACSGSVYWGAWQSKLSFGSRIKTES